jgi:GT2 family glycosyltransferase
LPALLHRIAWLRWTGLFRKAYSDYRRQTYDPMGVKPVEALMGAAVFVPRTAFEQSGRWDEQYRFGGEDLDLSTQINRQYRVVYHGGVTVVHHGRMSSKSNSEFVVGSVETGYVRYLRKAGCGRVKMFAYKLSVTLDTPFQWMLRTIQTGYRTLRRRPNDAAKSRETANGLWHFMTRDLGTFWRT